MGKFHNRLASIMHQHGTTTTTLTKQAGITQLSSISRIVHGRTLPSFGMLCKIIRALPADVDVRELLLGVEGDDD